MDAEQARSFLLTLPHAVETMQWGNNLVFWVGDKAIGGKMFTLIDLDAESRARISFAAGAELYHELLEQEGAFPAPYFARIHWVAVDGWDVFRPAVWQQHLRHAHELTFNKLPARTRANLALPSREQKRLIADHRRLLAVGKQTSAKPG